MPGTNLTRDEAAARAAVLDVESYAVELDLTGGGTDGEGTFRSVTTIRFDCTEPGRDTFVDLIAPAVHEVVLNGSHQDVEAVVSTARIALPGLRASNELRVVADAAYTHTGEGLHRFVDPVDDQVYLYSQFEVADARRVFACFDQPDLKATFAFTISAPSSWQLISTSPTPEPEVDGEVGTWRFAPTPVLSTYVTSVIAGPYHVVRDSLTVRDGRTIPMGVFCRASLAEHLDAHNVVDITRAGFAWFERTFDCDYPFAKYDQLFVPEFNAGAMENAGAVTITEVYVFRSKVTEALVERRALTLLHELAHMWFGDLVTMRWWDDLWLNESFAEYASTRCQAEATQWTGAWTTFLSSEKSWAYRQDQLASTHPIVADIRDLEDVEVNFDGITYAKGASVLKQLVHWVGQEAFDAGLRRYFAEHAWGNTTLADLLHHLEASSGRDLDPWAQEWLRTAGVTTLRPVVEVDDAGRLRRVGVEQEAPGGRPVRRPHRLAIAGYDLVDGQPDEQADGQVAGRADQRLARSWRVETDVAGPATDVPDAAGRPRPALLLVNDDDLAYGKIRLDDASLATALQHLGHFEDSLPRTLVWGASWDMTRDAELPARAFADLVLANVATVTDPSVAQTLLRQLAAALESYVAPEHRDGASSRAAGALAALMLAAEPGSDQQLLLTRSFLGQARTGEHLDRVAALYAGEPVVPGLALDTEMRWSLLSALVAGGRGGEDEIAAEQERDATASGAVHAAAVRAMIPTAEAKAEAWRLVVSQGSLPNTVQGAVIGGFGRVHDRSLLAPYVAPYFEALIPVWASRTNEMASQIVVGMYPHSQPVEVVQAATDAWLAGPGAGAEPALRRLVVEGGDTVARAARAQAFDARP